MDFPTAVRSCFAKYVTFSGRARRPEYWWFFLFVFLGSIVLGVVDSVLFGPAAAPHGQEDSAGPLTTIFQLLVFLPGLAAGWRRMHDTGRSGWLLLLPVLVSVAMWLIFLLGLAGLSSMEGHGGSAAEMQRSAAMIGGIGLVLLAIAQLVVSILMLWWLTRPTQPGDNAYGPEPQ